MADLRPLKDRIVATSVEVTDDQANWSTDDDGNMFEAVLLIIMCLFTIFFFLFTLCYSIIKRGKGELSRPDTPYRPRQFIAVDRKTGAVASGST